jgi:hypothetical protein
MARQRDQTVRVDGLIDGLPAGVQLADRRDDPVADQHVRASGTDQICSLDQ